MTTNKQKPPSIIDTETVKHIAFLVRLAIQEEDAQSFSDQLTSIIDYFHLLSEVNTKDVPSAAGTFSITNVMRPDDVLPSMSREDFLKNVPHRDGDYVRVPQVFGDDDGYEAMP
jgi:aspartyl-tRNA(Asn)/glutamyl-tRNA(Gln) amidotransferase subunit C